MGLQQTRNGSITEAMLLRTYLAQNDLSPAAFGVLVGASEHGVRKWISGERTPRPDAQRKIIEITNGAVTPNDFLSSAQPQEAA